MKVVICGSSHCGYHEVVRDEIVHLKREARQECQRLLIILGGEPGVETVAQEHCEKLGVDTIIQSAVRVLGSTSYFSRNELMLLYHKPEFLVCFALSFEESVVPADMLKRAELTGIETKAIDYVSIVKRDAYDISIRRVPH